MYKAIKLPVTTGNDFPQFNVIKHLRPISTHVVIGTNLFSDFMAGWTDVLGGRSNTYENKLREIYNQAIENLQYEAKKVGANCIIGLKIDIDEISGSGKSMFMITAIGTASFYEVSSKDNNIEASSDEDVIIYSEIKALKERKEIIDKSTKGQLKLDNKTWEFIINNKIEELAEYLFIDYCNEIHNLLDPKSEKFNNYKEYFTQYFLLIEKNKRIEIVYSRLLNQKHITANQKVIKHLIPIDIFNFEKIETLLSSENREIRKLGLRIASFIQSYYIKSDIENYSKLIVAINNAFPPVGKWSEKKQMLSNKNKNVWTCECSKVNNEDVIYCPSCHKDFYGFTEHEAKPKQVINSINENLDLLRELI